jgi:HEAT repeat protein/PBS lyase HEAT-like repeat-containing protein
MLGECERRADGTLRSGGLSVVSSRVLHRTHFAFVVVVAACIALLPRSSAAQYGGSRGPDSHAPGSNSPSQLGSGAKGQKRDAPNVDELAKDLRDDDADKRLEAVKSLGTSQEKSAVEYLIQATADPDARVKLKAIDALGTLRASDATLVLVQVLYLHDSEPWLRQRVLVALGKIGDNRAVRPITEYLARENDVSTMGNAIFALGEIGDTQAIGDLERIGQRTSDQRLVQLSQDAIGKIKQKQINPEVTVKALRDRDGDEQRPAGASSAPPVAY